MSKNAPDGPGGFAEALQGCAPISPSSGASRRKERPRRNPRSAFQGVEDDHLPSRSIMIYRD